RGRDRPASGVLKIERGQTGQKTREMFSHADWSDTRTAAAMRNAKGFVQIQMANIGTDLSRPAKTDLRVHVCSIHVDLAAMFVHDLADLANRGFENTVS